MKRLTKQCGISLVEVLVALLLSLFLLAGIVQVYVGNRATFSFTGALAEIQENGRFALDLMSQDLRLAGVWACVAYNPDDTSNINDTLTAATVPGYDADFHDFLDQDGITGTDNDGLNNSDTIRFRGGKASQTNVEAPFLANTDRRLYTDTIDSIGAGDIILVARCGANDLGANTPEADIISVDSVVPGTDATQRLINIRANKSQLFGNDGVIIELQTVTYSIAAGASGQPALFRQEFNAAAQELVEGVENMQVLYGVDNDNDQFPNQYVIADNVVDFDDVVAIRINLLLRSIDDFVAEAPQPYTFDGVQTTPADRRIRQEFTTTVALRNRIGSSR